MLTLFNLAVLLYRFLYVFVQDTQGAVYRFGYIIMGRNLEQRSLTAELTSESLSVSNTVFLV